MGFSPDKVDEIDAALDQALSTPTEVIDQMRVTVGERIKHLTPEFVADQILQAIHYVF